MRNIVLVVSILVLSAWTYSSGHEDKLGVTGPLTFGEVVFELSEVEQVDSVTIVQTYTTKENENYSESLYVQLIEQTDSAKSMVADKVFELAERKRFDLFCEYNVMQSPDAKEFVIYYQEVFQTMNEPAKVEFNCRHYTAVNLSDNTPAVVIYGYSRIYVTDNIDEAVKKVEGITQSSIDEMMSGSIPKVNK